MKGEKPVNDDSPNRSPVGLLQQAKVTFAGGCFWCMEEAFEKIEGVVAAVSGYTGGQIEIPTYEQVSAGGTGHTKSIAVISKFASRWSVF